MTPERWQKVSELYQAAVERPPEQRADFVRRMCDGDVELHQEVEALLAAEDSAGSFMSGDAIEDAARMMAEEQTGSLTGQTISHYRVLELLGQGGMGEVYLAEDTHLKRKVAFKVLPTYFLISRNRVARFEQEARTVSALNHPNIVTIHEVGRSHNSSFIVTEFVDGSTLRELISQSSPPVSEALDWAMQVASALEAAHAAGVIHRDIKPENIMVRRDGYVKVLDFGLAKLAERQTTTKVGDAPTKIFARTQPGVVMGSTSYMSPEQARGIAVDERSDIWSLGVVLYEMLTRQVPFNGETQSDVIAAIIERQPASVTSLAPNLPPQLEWIITKALKKNRDERYQTIREMRSDLRELKQGLETQAHLERSGVPVAQSMSTGGATQPPGTAPATHATSSAEYIVGELKRHKLGAALALGFFGLLLIGGVVGLYKLLTRHQVDAPVRAPKFTALTTGGRIADQLIDGEVTISPDGKYVTYVATDERGRQSLWLKQVSTNTQVQLVPPGPYNYNDAIFSPDEEFIYYVRNEGRSEATVYRVPVIGGSSVKVFENIVSSICVSPDGRRLAFVRIGSAAGQKLPSQQLMLANTDGSGEPSVLVSLKPPQHFALWPAPSWSPDGKMIAIAYAPQAGLIRHTLVGVSVVDGRITPLTSEKWSSVGRVIWMPDGKGLVFTAAPDLNSIGLQLWYLDYPEGKARRITNDLNGYGDFSLGVTADGSTIATLQTRATWNIWVIAPYEDESRAKQITNDGMVDGYYSLSWLPDGRLIYNSRAGEKPDLWVVNADGTNRTQLTNDAYREYYARASPDGRYIVFESERSGGLRLWRINADGSSPKQLTEGNDDLVRFDFSPDSQWVVFSSRSTGTRSFWKVSIQGGAAEHLSDELGFIPTVSPDGKLIATIRIKPQSGDQVSTELALLPFESGPKVKTIAWPQISGVGGAQWTPDGQALYCIRFVNNLNNIWRLSLDGSPPKQVTNFTSENLWNYALSPDGRRLAVSRGHKVNDIVLIREFR